MATATAFDAPLAMSAASNRSTAPKAPYDWLASSSGYHCWYVFDWVAAKIRYRLSIDAAGQATSNDGPTAPSPSLSPTDACVRPVILVG